MPIQQIAFFSAKPYEKEFFNVENAAFHFPIVYFEERLTEKTAHLAKGSSILCPFVNDLLNDKVIQKLSEIGIKLLALRSAGYNHVDLMAAKKQQIPVVRVPIYSPYAIAEHAVALLLSLNRKLHRAHLRTKNGDFRIDEFVGFDLHGKTAGIIGVGHIGKAIATILKGLGMKLLGYDIAPDPSFAKEMGLNYVDLNTLYRASDVITIHANLSQSNYHMIDAKALASMKKGVVLINTARGGHINTQDLIEALKNGHVGAAGLDVYENESPYFREDFSNRIIEDDLLARLLSFSNVLITAHQAYLTQDALRNIARITLENIQGFLTHQPLTNQVSS